VPPLYRPGWRPRLTDVGWCTWACSNRGVGAFHLKEGLGPGVDGFGVKIMSRSMPRPKAMDSPNRFALLVDDHWSCSRSIKQPTTQTELHPPTCERSF
jgi:hypothetical protein